MGPSTPRSRHQGKFTQGPCQRSALFPRLPGPELTLSSPTAIKPTPPPQPKKNVGIRAAGPSGAMPIPGADSGHSSFLLAKCGSTLFCIGRSVFLWVIVLAVFLLGAARNRLLATSRRASPTGDKKP